MIFTIILSSTTVVNINNNRKSFLNLKLAFFLSFLKKSNSALPNEIFSQKDINSHLITPIHIFRRTDLEHLHFLQCDLLIGKSVTISKYDNL